MDLNRAAIFVRVVEAESFSVAARALGLSKSSTSRFVSQLEEELGVQLLQRTTRKLRLTDAGQMFYTSARHALTELDEAASAVSALGEEPRGIVRMTAPIDMGILMLGDLIAEFQQRYPLIYVELDLSSRVVDLIGEGYDLALRAGVLNDSTLVARKVGTTALGIFASERYLHARGEPKTAKDLAHHTCVLFQPRNGKSVWRMTGPAGEETIEVTGSVGSNELLFNRRAIELGLGIGAFPLFFAEGCPASQHFVRVLPEYTFKGGSVYLVLPSARHVPSRVAVLRDFLVEKLTAIDWTVTTRARDGNAKICRKPLKLDTPHDSQGKSSETDAVENDE